MPGMKIEAFLKDHLLEIIELARHAPSVHNTQPWKVSAEKNSIIVSIDSRFQLTDGDPTGRETIISLGIFTEAVCSAAAELGLKVRSCRISNKTVVIVFRDEIKPITKKTFETLIKGRFTDRSVYQPVIIDDSIVQKLEHLQRASGITIRVANKPVIIEAVADLTAKAIKLALSNPSFGKELGDYLVQPWSKKSRGIATQSLQLPWYISTAQPFMVRHGLGNKNAADLERERWQSASALVIITADGDLEEYWFETGRTYLRVSLTIEKLGLSQATSAAIVEASNYHEDIEGLLRTKQRILSIIRIGAGSGKKVHSPRAAATELIT